MRRTALAAMAAALLVPAAAHAHPHVLIDAHAILEMQAGRIVSLYVGWKFDPVYSGTLVQDFDADKNGTFDPPELAAMEKEAFQDTAKQGYFTYVKVNGKPVETLAAKDFKVIVAKDAIIYGFRLALPQPVDPRAQRFSVVTYEETYYIDIAYPNERAVVLNGDGAAGCAGKMVKDASAQVLGGLVTPYSVTVACDGK